MACRVAFYVNSLVWPTCKRCIGSSFKIVYTFKYLLSAKKGTVYKVRTLKFGDF